MLFHPSLLSLMIFFLAKMTKIPLVPIASLCTYSSLRCRWWAASAQLGTVAEPLQDEEAGHAGNGADPALRQPAIRRLPPPEVEVTEPGLHHVEDEVCAHHREVSADRASP